MLRYAYRGIKKTMTIMLVSDSHRIRNYKSGNNVMDISEEAGAFYLQAIENADGVPFQLIFGQEIGEGYYPNNGGGIKDLLGISPGDLTERAFLDLVQEFIPLSSDIPDDLSSARKMFVNGAIRNFKADIRIKTVKGETKWIRDSSLPLTDRNSGKVIGAFGIYFDVTKLRNNHNAVPDTYSAHLTNAFLRNVSHEIRTPLNAIVGLSSIIGEPGQSKEQLEEFRNIMVKSSDHLLDIVMNIIEMSRIDAGLVTINPLLTDLRKLAETIMGHYIKPAQDKKLILNLEYKNCDDKLVVYADEAKLIQVLRQLVENAIKFTSEGTVNLTIEQNNNIFRFCVSDTGPGIPIDKQAKIFESFYQVESSITRNYGGTGLGLSIAKAYIEMMGGKLSLISKPGSGSCFSFALPLSGSAE